MRSDRPGYQYRRNKDGRVVHYWNPKRVGKGIPGGVPPIVRFPDDITDADLISECQRLTAELRAGHRFVDEKSRKRRNISEQLYKMYRKRARDIGKPFAISAQWLHSRLEAIGDRCEIGGIEFNYEPQPRATKKYFKHPLRPSLDRIDNDGGYVPGNVRVVLHCVNIGLNEWGLDNYVAVCKAVAAHQREAFPDLSGPDGKLLVSTDW